MFSIGDPIPSLFVRSRDNPRYSLDSVAGRHVVLMFIGGRRVPGVDGLLAQLYRDRTLFDDTDACCFIVTGDAEDVHDPMLRDRYPGIRVLYDEGHELARRFGCVLEEAGARLKLRLLSFILDPRLCVASVLPIEDFAGHVEALRTTLNGLGKPSIDEESWAPVLRVPNVLEPELCRRFIAYAQEQGVEDSGYMKTDPASGKTIAVVDHTHKRRQDCSIEDEGLRAALQARIMRRLVPQIERAFQFRVTRMERYLIGCYQAETGGYFRPHKDNTTLGTAHRRFAVSINLNADDYEGGELRFPEFGRRTYRAPTGGAVVFSCSLLHEATPILRGTRYCILPFLYDEVAAQLRLDNARHLDDPVLREQVIASVLAKPGAVSANA